MDKYRIHLRYTDNSMDKPLEILLRHGYTGKRYSVYMVNRRIINMKVSYKKLWKLLIDLNMSTADLRRATGLATGTMTKLHKDEDVSLDALKRICQVCHCNIGDIMDVYPDNETFRVRTV